MKTLLTLIAISVGTIGFTQVDKTTMSPDKASTKTSIQPGQDSKTQIQMQTDRLTRELNLTPAQSKETLEMAQTYYEDNALMSNERMSSTDRDAMRTKSMDKFDASLKTILDEKQYAKFSSMRGELLMDMNQPTSETAPSEQKQIK